MLEEAGLEELAPLTAVDPSIALPAVPAQKTAAEPVTAGAVAAPPPEPAAETPVEAPPAVNPEPDAPPAPDVVQTAPTNVNISVRIDSPGDNGSVEQVNVAASTGGAAAAAAPPAETAPQYQPDPPQYQQPIPASAAPAADSAPQPPAAEPAQPVEGWTWNWNWNCGDAIPDIPLPPEVGTQNWTWNWDWDCGDPDPIPTNTSEQNTSQYQPGVTQYRSININISIHINSPGNNGLVRSRASQSSRGARAADDSHRGARLTRRAGSERLRWLRGRWRHWPRWPRSSTKSALIRPKRSRRGRRMLLPARAQGRRRSRRRGAAEPAPAAGAADEWA